MAEDEQQPDEELQEEEEKVEDEHEEPADDEPETIEAARAALADERRAHSAARKESAKHRRQRAELERELEREKAKGLSEAERLAGEQKQAGREEADAEWRDRYLREAVSAAAGGKMRDPDDAYGLLEAAGELGELRELEPDEMRGAARARVDKLVDRKPYLAAGAERDEEKSAGARSIGVRRRIGGSSNEAATGDENAWLRKAARK